MKRILVLSIILLTVSLSAFSSVGYTISGVGYSSDVNYGGIGLSLLYEIDKTPVSLEVGVNLGTSTLRNGMFMGANALIKVYPISFMNHPFKFMFQNDVYYRPLLCIGYDYFHLSENPSTIIFKLALMHFEDLHFRYSYLTPFMSLNSKGEIAGWGIELMKMSYVF